MKSIKIVPENAQKITIALQDAQKYCKARTMDYERLAICLERICDMFNGVPKSAMVGLRISVGYWAETFPNAYTRKGRPESTICLIECRPSGWYLENAFRGYTRGTSRAIAVETMPEAVKTALISSHMSFGMR